MLQLCHGWTGNLFAGREKSSNQFVSVLVKFLVLVELFGSTRKPNRNFQMPIRLKRRLCSLCKNHLQFPTHRLQEPSKGSRHISKGRQRLLWRSRNYIPLGGSRTHLGSPKLGTSPRWAEKSPKLTKSPGWTDKIASMPSS